jgi:outer membrane protein OmpA-like peptidoglycan-associated protein
MTRFVRFVTLFCSFLLLFACAKTKDVYVDTLEGQRRALIQDYAYELSDVGGQLVLVGETVRMIFPGDVVFNFCSANLNHDNLYLLDDAAELMRKLETVNVKISGYTGCQDSFKLNRSLSKRQTEVFAEYMFEQGLDARIVHTVGYATNHPIAMPTDVDDEQSEEVNRRIEVSFQYLPLLRQY